MLLKWKLLKIFFIVVIVAITIYFLVVGIQNGVIAS